MKPSLTVAVKDMKLCVNCAHYSPPENLAKTPDAEGFCYHPKNVTLYITHSPVTGLPLPKPVVRMEIESVSLHRQHDHLCGIKGARYEAKPLATLVAEANPNGGESA